MTNKEKKAPIVNYEDEQFEIVEQDHYENGTIQIKYLASSGRTALIILRQNNTYDEYIYNLEEEMIHYGSKELKG